MYPSWSTLALGGNHERFRIERLTEFCADLALRLDQKLVRPWDVLPEVAELFPTIPSRRRYPAAIILRLALDDLRDLLTGDLERWGKDIADWQHSLGRAESSAAARDRFFRAIGMHEFRRPNPYSMHRFCYALLDHFLYQLWPTNQSVAASSQ